jgi:hypothetical protein
MQLFPMHTAVDNDVAGQHSFAALVRKLDEGWQIEQPVYVMADPLRRSQLVFRMMVWRNGRPHVITVRDCAEMRQFLADRRLKQQSL